MPPTMLTATHLARLVGLPDAPAIVDVRTEAFSRPVAGKPHSPATSC
ncbi:MAG TPA: hypothetical protein VIJ78_11280 [Pseudolabrys sp.]